MAAEHAGAGISKEQSEEDYPQNLKSHLEKILASFVTDDDVQSISPISEQLGLKKLTCLLAQLTVCIICPSFNKNTRSFSVEQERTFAHVQCACNRLLSSRGLKPIQLLHLTPRMLITVQPSPKDSTPTGCEVPIKTKSKGKKSKKKSICQKHVGFYDEQREISPSNNSEIVSDPRHTLGDDGADEHMSEFSPNESKALSSLTSVKASQSTDDHVSFCDIICVESKYILPAPTPTGIRNDKRRCPHHTIPSHFVANAIEASKEVNPDARANAVYDLCDAYESLLSEQRERYDLAIQALNLRLYIAETALENHKDQMTTPSKN